MQVFDSNGEFNNIKRVDFSDNNRLTVNISFEYLSGTKIDYFDIQGCITTGKVDFGYLSNDIEIRMDVSVFCIDSECNGN